MLSFVAADCGSRDESHFGCADGVAAPIAFGISEQIGKTWIRNVRLSRGSAERWSQEFEHGRVLLNMASTPWRDVELHPPPGCQYQRLAGTVDRTVNNGRILGAGLVNVPPQDALFLRKVCADE